MHRFFAIFYSAGFRQILAPLSRWPAVITLAILWLALAAVQSSAAPSADVTKNVSAGKSSDNSESIADDISEEDKKMAARVAKLIQELGNLNYPIRQRAQEQLSELGAVAFDALTEAENHRDLEIAHRARYLVHQIGIDWIRADDAASVRQELTDYANATESVRLSKLETLAAMPDDAGLSAICRVVRFEPSTEISKRAALLVLNLPRVETDRWQSRSDIIRRELALSGRPSAKWLRVYARYPINPTQSVSDWQALLDDEIRLFEKFPTDAQRVIVSALLRQQWVMLTETNAQAPAQVTLDQILKHESSTSESLQSLLEWSIQHKYWTLVDAIASHQGKQIDSNGQMLYMLAKARKEQGKSDQANELVTKALKLNPDNAEHHIVMADWLKKRGLFDWCEQECKWVIAYNPAAEPPKATPPKRRALLPEDQEEPRPKPVEGPFDARVSPFRLLARNMLAEIQADHERYQEAADTLQDLITSLEQNKELMRFARGAFGINPAPFRSRIYFYQAKHLARQPTVDRVKERELLDQSLNHEYNNADVLIALYRLPEQTEEQRASIMKKIQSVANEFRNKISEQDYENMAKNQYAWLIANTEGDFDEALRMSQQSIESEPSSGGYMDTLAHCYAAKKDFAKAVEVQTKAVALEPHSQEIGRALTRFKHAAERAKTEGNVESPAKGT
ncbi:MAG: tetratricopeptide repeat protein [Planctomycetota bacterium]|nr:tetratricopeptide repeat protein [Planctomycetota bacterium]